MGSLVRRLPRRGGSRRAEAKRALSAAGPGTASTPSLQVSQTNEWSPIRTRSRPFLVGDNSQYGVTGADALIERK
jgi:hypothetical protein